MKKARDAKRVAIIEARMKSTRLPGKVLRPIMGRPMLDLLVERLQQARNLDQIVVATTDSDADEPIEALAQQLGIGCHRGSEEDVLDRVLTAARRFEADVIVEVTADCPLIEASKVDDMLRSYQYMDVDFMGNRLDGTYPVGLGMRIFSRDVLERIDSLTRDPVDREHVTLYVWEHPDIFSIYHFQNNLDRRYWDIRLTVDTKEDFAFIETVFEELYPLNPRFGLYDIIDLLERRPELMDINRHVRQKPVR
ncbi:MAG TPA: glycosyltransferase family protein [Syntrophales bacterium]|nr:glycosyltransferase family protein [Syntrophales bacterium]